MSPSQPSASPKPLPLPPTPWLGRERKVATPCALLRSPAIRLATLTGPGGVGRTRLVPAAVFIDSDALPRKPTEPGDTCHAGVRSTPLRTGSSEPMIRPDRVDDFPLAIRSGGRSRNDDGSIVGDPGTLTHARLGQVARALARDGPSTEEP